MTINRRKGGIFLEGSLELNPASGAMLCTGQGSVCGLVQRDKWGCSAAASCVALRFSAHVMRTPADSAILLALPRLLLLARPSQPQEGPRPAGAGRQKGCYNILKIVPQYELLWLTHHFSFLAPQRSRHQGHTWQEPPTDPFPFHSKQGSEVHIFSGTLKEGGKKASCTIFKISTLVN